MKNSKKSFSQSAATPPALLVLTFWMIALLDQTPAITIREDVDVERYFHLAQQPEFAAAGYLLHRPGELRSAVLVAPNKVLTAARNLDTVPGQEGFEGRPEDFMFGLGSEVPEQFINNVIEIAIHPGYDHSFTENESTTHDIAVLTLADPIISVLPARVTGRNPIGRIATMVGYGRATTNEVIEYENENPINPIILPGDPDRMAAQNVIDVVGTTTDRFVSLGGAANRLRCR